MGNPQSHQDRPAVLDRLNAELLDSDRSPASVRSYLRQINVFLRWCEREGEGSTATAQLPKVPKKLVAVLTRDEIRRLEEAGRTERDKLVVRTLADTGLRLSELLGMRVQDVEQDSHGWSVWVMGKGARERRVVIARPWAGACSATPTASVQRTFTPTGCS